MTKVSDLQVGSKYVVTFEATVVSNVSSDTYAVLQPESGGYSDNLYFRKTDQSKVIFTPVCPDEPEDTFTVTLTSRIYGSGPWEYTKKPDGWAMDQSLIKRDWKNLWDVAVRNNHKVTISKEIY